MNPQQQLQLGMKLRDSGIASVEFNNLSWVERMREVAREISQNQGYVCADDLRRYANKHNDQPGHVNGWGAVFRAPGWVAIGRKKSTTPTAHARWIMVWKFRGKGND